MLSRRFLRIKAFQAVFAYKQRVKSNYNQGITIIDDFFAPDLNSMETQDHQLLRKKAEISKTLFDLCKKNAQEIDNETDHTIVDAVTLAQQTVSKLNIKERELVRNVLLQDIENVQKEYIELLQFLVELAEVQAKQEGLWIPNKLSENSLIQTLKKSKKFNSYIAKYSIDWNQDEQLPRKIYLEKLLHLEVIERLNKEGHLSAEEDFKVIKKILKKGVFRNGLVNDYFEEKDTYWNENKEIIEKAVIKTFKKISLEQNLELSIPDGEEWEDDKNFFVELFNLSTATDSKVEQIYQSNLKNWEREKLSDSDDVIVLIALNEMANFSSIPLKVTMNEYIEIAKLYSTPKSQTFVNGLIDSVSRVMKDQKVIKKSGRGLLDNQ
jgi:N utilization substance protein B